MKYKIETHKDEPEILFKININSNDGALVVSGNDGTGYKKIIRISDTGILYRYPDVMLNGMLTNDHEQIRIDGFDEAIDP